MQDAKEEVRSRLNIEDVIGEYVQLKRAGRNFKGLSPFSGEKTPSFIVSPDKLIWHDFSSNKGGDIFSFIMEVEGVDFKQALEILARKAGVDLSLYDSKNNRDFSRRKRRLLEANELAASYYQFCLLKNQHALEYVFKYRRLSKEVVKNFRIGYAPVNGDALMQFLKKKGFTKNELSDAGLSNRFDGDIFRGRITIPLMDPSGQVIGFTARIIKDDLKSPKYLNTPQTLIYDKSRHVFGLSQAKETIRKNNYAVMVEGNLDVISSHQVGIDGVVATAGTAMTENHLRVIKRLTSNIKLAFDGDKAGLAATERAIPIASSEGIDLSIISLPIVYKDPDELIQKDKKMWQEAIDNAEPAIDWILKQYQKREDISTASGKKNFTTMALKIISELNDPVEKEHYEQKISKLINVSLEAIKSKSFSKKQDTPLRRVHEDIKKEDRNTARNDKNITAFMSILCRDVKIQQLLERVDVAIFEDQQQKDVIEYIKNNIGSVIQEIPSELQHCEKYVTMLLLNIDADTLPWSDKFRFESASRVLRLLEKKYRIRQIEARIQEADNSGDDDKANRLREQLIKERNNNV